MHAAPPTGQTLPIIYTTDHRVKFKYPLSTTRTYNTQDNPHLLGIRYQALSSMGILDTGATGFFITKKYDRLAGMTTLGPSNKTIAVVDNTAIHFLHKTCWNLLESTPAWITLIKSSHKWTRMLFIILN